MSPIEWKLVLPAVIAVAMLVLLITRWKLNPFIGLVLASLVAAAGAQWIGPSSPGGQQYDLIKALKSFSDGMGATLGGIAAVIGLGAMMGKLLAESGGADKLAEKFVVLFGKHRAVMCIMALGFVIGLATWFAVGLALLLPVLFSLTRQTGASFLQLAIPMAVCLSLMHGLTPPHPGPVVAAEALKASNGLVLFWGVVVAIPTSIIAGPLFMRWFGPSFHVDPPSLETASNKGGERNHITPPGWGLTLGTLGLPVVLMMLAAITELFLPKENLLRQILGFTGHPVLALIISVLFACWSLGLRCGWKQSDVLRFTEVSIASVGMTLLVVGGGGGFARVLRDCGTADALAALASKAELPPMIYGWLIAVLVRIATGSATVAASTAASLAAPMLLASPNVHPELAVVAIGCGSLILSHLNDGGFWMLKEGYGLTVGQTIRTWTWAETMIGFAGALIAWGISLLLPGRSIIP